MKIKFLLLAVLVSQIGFGQNCRFELKGEITDLHDGIPIHGATIHIKELDRFAVTDRSGKFKFSQLCAGQFTLEISHVGCVPKEEKISLKGDLFKKISLEHHLESLDEVMVKAKPSHTLERERTIQKDLLDNYSASELGDVLKEVSGVSSINTGNSIVKPVINGMHSSRILVMNDGVRLQDQEWGIEHAPNVDINSAENITVIKGAAALAYGGDAMGGVVVLEPPRLSVKDSLYGKTILGGQQNGRGLSVTTALNKSFKSGWYFAGQGSYKKMGDFKAPDYYLTNSGMNSAGVNIRAGYKNVLRGFDINYSFVENEFGILSAAHIGSIEDLVNAIENEQPSIAEDFDYAIEAPKQMVKHHLFKANFYHRFEGLGKLNLQYDFQHNNRLEFDKRVGDDRNKAALDLSLKTHTISTNFKLDADNRRLINMGLLYRYQENFPDPNTGVRRLIPDYIKFDAGAFITGAWDLNSKLHLDAGLRYDFNRIDAKKFYRKSDWEELDYDDNFGDFIIDDFEAQWLTQPVLNYHNLSLSVGLGYRIDDKSTFYFNYNKSNRAPNPSELFSDGLHHSAARIEYGDLNLSKEKGHRFSAAYHFLTGKFSARTEFFYSRVNDYIYATPGEAQQTIRGAFPVWSYGSTDAEILGGDLTMELSFNEQFSFTNKTAFIQGKSTLTDTFLVDMPATNTENTITYHNKKWYNFKTSLTSDLVFKKKNFPNFNFEQFIPTTQSLVVVDISTPPKGYHLMHFKAEMTFKLAKMDLGLGLNVNNIFDVSYRDYLNRLRFFADDLGRNMSLQIKLNY